jgi:FKBP-type peptidyl-prolyl cis-trans isomerase FkpA
MKYLKHLAVLMLAAIIFTSCGDSSFKTTETGLQYKFYENVDGPTPNVGDLITLNMIYGTADTIIFDGRNIPTGMETPLDSSVYPGDLFEGWAMMSEGDSASFLISADSLFLTVFKAPSLPPYIEPGEFLTFDVKMISFRSMEEKSMEEAGALEEYKVKAGADLASYLETNNINTEPLESGLIFIEEKKGSGPKPTADDAITINITISGIDGTEIYTTIGREPVEYMYGLDTESKGLEQGVGMLSKGGKARLIVPHQIAFGAEARGEVITPYSTIIYDVELVDMRPKAEYEAEMAARSEMQAQQQAQQQVDAAQKMNEEQGLRDKYLAENGITTQPTASGLYYVETEAGTGPKASAGSTVSVHYTGALLDGTEFDSSLTRGTPYTFTLGRGEVIRGWDEAIAMMSKGGKATLVIPSSMAYGAQDRGNIPPYATLVFDVELVDVK